MEYLKIFTIITEIGDSMSLKGAGGGGGGTPPPPPTHTLFTELVGKTRSRSAMTEAVGKTDRLN